MSSGARDVLQRIVDVQAVLHGAGTVSRDALSAIARQAESRSGIQRSVETGCGATTLLLSHLSQHHTVFALDVGGSVANVRRSPLLREGVVSFVEGPSQKTLPLHSFPEKLQLAVIDGPHAYPFPDLEYYYLYPHLDTGSLLVLDDIHVRSIHNLFEFLREDEMFRLEEVVRNTAFFTRTDAPTFDPHGDGWADQRYNARTLFRYDWRSRLKSAMPQKLFRGAAAYRSAKRACAVRILSPRRGEKVSEAGVVHGEAMLGAGEFVWVLARRKGVDGWWPQGDGAAAVADGSWSVQAVYGGPQDSECAFELAAVIVTEIVHERWVRWVEDVKRTGAYPPVQLPTAPHVLAETFQTVHKGASGG